MAKFDLKHLWIDMGALEKLFVALLQFNYIKKKRKYEGSFSSIDSFLAFNVLSNLIVLNLLRIYATVYWSLVLLKRIS